MKSYTLLTKVERRQALLKILNLVRLKLGLNIEFEDIEQEFPRLSLACAKTIFGMSGFAPIKHIELINDLDKRFSRLLVESDCEIFIVGRPDNRDSANEILLNFLWKYLGGEGSSAERAPGLSQLKKDVVEAFLVIQEFDFGIDLIKQNTGVVVPFPCTSPESGSGTSKLLPGCLMLPSGTPAAMLAECWLHECMHTELYLAEWLSGQELATSDEPVNSPWRTTNRSANLLLHGCFVFSNVARFIRLARKHYVSIERTWQLSAAKGRVISVAEVENVCDFRIEQVKEALKILGNRVEFSPLGKIVYERVHSEVSMF